MGHDFVAEVGIDVGGADVADALTGQFTHLNVSPRIWLPLSFAFCGMIVDNALRRFGSAPLAESSTVTESLARPAGVC